MRRDITIEQFVDCLSYHLGIGMRGFKIVIQSVMAGFNAVATQYNGAGLGWFVIYHTKPGFHLIIRYRLIRQKGR